MTNNEIKVVKEGSLDILNWNIGGAKYLELKAGPPKFVAEEILDPLALAHRLSVEDDLVGAFIREREASGVEAIAKRSRGVKSDPPSDEVDSLRKDLADLLTGVLDFKDLYEPDRFKHIRLRKETRKWVATKAPQHFAAAAQTRLNRCLLEDAFAGLISQAHETREEFRERLNDAFAELLRDNNPAIVTLQEVVQYQASKHTRREDVLVPPDNYYYFAHWLIDTDRHSAQGKWTKVRKAGDWSNEAFFAQGNAILIRKDMPHFRLYDLPDVQTTVHDIASAEEAKEWDTGQGSGHIEPVALESGIYFGDRNTEPRAAILAHITLSYLEDQRLTTPLDVMIINLHLTTLSNEREGIPDTDEKASQTRLQQLNIVLDGIVSRYNQWRKDKYKIRDQHQKNIKGKLSIDRHSPVWVIAGDFNCTPDSPEYQTFVRRGFIDLVTHKGSGTKAAGLGNEPTITLDYVFAGPRYEAIDPNYAAAHTGNNRVRVDDTMKVSDHFPLTIKVPLAVAE
jgi:endonuclease/exonuclease/phosphatase family metal-dependent hydrolase